MEERKFLPSGPPRSFPFLNQTEEGHGRLGNPKYTFAPISPVEAGLPYARCAFQSTRTWVGKKAFIERDLALTRNALPAIIPFDGKTTLITCLNNYQSHLTRAFKFLLHARPI